MTPAVMLVVTLVLCTVGFTVLFWGVALTLQGLLYNQPADRLPLRALVAGLFVACFITFWTYANTRASHPDKYGTLFEFNATAIKPVEEFQAVRRQNMKDEKGQMKESTATYKWIPGGGPSGGEFVDTETQKAFARASTNYVTVSLEVKDAAGQKKKFTAPMTGMTYSDLKGTNQNVTFVEEGGAAFISDQNLHTMELPSSSGFLMVMVLNVVHFAVWAVAFWVFVRFRVGHALLLMCLFGSVTMFILMPLLFNKNAVKPAAIGARA